MMLRLRVSNPNSTGVESKPFGITIDGKSLYLFCNATNILFFITLPVSEDGFHLQVFVHYSLNYCSVPSTVND